jgi:hypothetical protein
MQNNTREKYELILSTAQDGKCMQAYGAPSNQGATYHDSNRIVKALRGALPTHKELMQFLVKDTEEQEKVRGLWGYLGNATIDDVVDRGRTYVLRREHLAPFGPSSDPEQAVYVGNTQSGTLSFLIRESLEMDSRFCIDGRNLSDPAPAVFIIRDVDGMLRRERKEFVNAMEERDYYRMPPL